MPIFSLVRASGQGGRRKRWSRLFTGRLNQRWIALSSTVSREKSSRWLSTLRTLVRQRQWRTVWWRLTFKTAAHSHPDHRRGSGNKDETEVFFSPPQEISHGICRYCDQKHRSGRFVWEPCQRPRQHPPTSRVHCLCSPPRRSIRPAPGAATQPLACRGCRGTHRTARFQGGEEISWLSPQTFSVHVKQPKPRSIDRVFLLYFYRKIIWQTQWPSSRGWRWPLSRLGIWARFRRVKLYF